VKRALFISLGLLALALPREALAYHTNEDRQTDFSAFTLHRNQWRVGLFQAEYGILDSWNVGTYTMPWILMPVAKAPALNLYTKWKFLQLDKWAAAIRLNAFYLQLNNLAVSGMEDGDFNATVFPFTVVTSHVFNDDWTASLESTWVQTAIRGDVESAGDSSALGASAQSNLQFALTGEYRLSKLLALNFVGRWVPYVTAARIVSTADTGDGIEVDIEAEIAADGVRNAWLAQVGFTYSWKYFNLQAGVGYGNLIVPGLKIAAAAKTIMPDFDVYFRF
jgi:hypothetical protein